MRKVFFILSVLISFLAKGQAVYNPSYSSMFNTSNKTYGISSAYPVDGRTYKIDSINVLGRPYNTTAEVLTYLPLSIPKYRMGNFPIVVHVGGTLNSNGTYTGGINQLYWFKNGFQDSNLVRWYTDSTGLSGALLAANNLSDLQNVAAARTNLGLGSMAQQNLTAASTDITGNWPSSLIVNSIQGHNLAYIQNYNNLSNRPTIPAQFNPIQGPGISLGGVYPNITFSATAANSIINQIDTVQSPGFNVSHAIGDTAIFNHQFTAHPTSGDSNYEYYGVGGDNVQGWANTAGFGQQYAYYTERSGGQDWWDDNFSFDTANNLTQNYYGDVDYGFGIEQFYSNSKVSIVFNKNARLSGGDTPVIEAITDSPYYNYQLNSHAPPGGTIGGGYYWYGYHGKYGASPGNNMFNQTGLTQGWDDLFIDTSGAYSGRAYNIGDTSWVVGIIPGQEGELAHDLGKLVGKPIYSTDIKGLPAQFNPIQGSGISLSGTYPNITFSASSGGILGFTNGLTDSSGYGSLGGQINQTINLTLPDTSGFYLYSDSAYFNVGIGANILQGITGSLGGSSEWGLNTIFFSGGTPSDSVTAYGATDSAALTLNDHTFDISGANVNPGDQSWVHLSQNPGTKKVTYSWPAAAQSDTSLVMGAPDIHGTIVSKSIYSTDIKGLPGYLNSRDDSTYVINLRTVSKYVDARNSYYAGVLANLPDKSCLSMLSGYFTDWNVFNYSQGGDDLVTILSRMRNNDSTYGYLGIRDWSHGDGYICFNEYTNSLGTIITPTQNGYSVYNAYLDTLSTLSKAYGYKPVIETEWTNNRYVPTDLSIYAQQNGYLYYNTYAETAPFDAYQYSHYYYLTHPGVRVNSLEWRPMISLLNKLGRPKNSIKIFRLRPGITQPANVQSVSFIDRTAQNRLFKEISISQTVMAASIYQYWDSLIAAPDIRQSLSEYESLMMGNSIPFSDNYGLIQCVYNGTAKNTNYFGLYVSDSTVQVYAKNNSTELWDTLTFNPVTHLFELKNYDEIAYDKISFLLYKSGGFSLTNAYFKWQGKTGKNYTEKAQILDSLNGNELLATTSVQGGLGNWNHVGTTPYITVSDSTFAGNLNVAEFTGSNYINQSITIPTPINGNSAVRRLQIKVIARRYVPPYGPHTSFSLSPVTSNTYDFATLSVAYTDNTSGYPVIFTDQVGMQWQSSTFQLYIPSTATTGTITIRSLDSTIQFASGSVQIEAYPANSTGYIVNSAINGNSEQSPADIHINGAIHTHSVLQADGGALLDNVAGNNLVLNVLNSGGVTLLRVPDAANADSVISARSIVPLQATNTLGNNANPWDSGYIQNVASNVSLRLSWVPSNNLSLRTGFNNWAIINGTTGQQLDSGNVLPATDSTFNLGGPSNAWNNIYTKLPAYASGVYSLPVENYSTHRLEALPISSLPGINQNLQQVTNIGATTTNEIETSTTGTGFESQMSSASISGFSGLSAFSDNLTGNGLFGTASSAWTLNTTDYPAILPNYAGIIGTIGIGIAALGIGPINFSTNGTMRGGFSGNGLFILNNGLNLTLGSDATGDIFYRNSSGNFNRLGIGSSGNVLTVSGGIPSWQAGPTATNFAAGQQTTVTNSGGTVTYSAKYLDTVITFSTTSNTSSSSTVVYASTGNLIAGKTYKVSAFILTASSGVGGINFSINALGAANTSSILSYIGSTTGVTSTNLSTTSGDGTNSGNFNTVIGNGYVEIQGTFTTATGVTSETFGFRPGTNLQTATVTGPGSYVSIRQIN